MICKVKETINKFSMFNETDRVVVGFSGGADSMCLLYVLNALKSELNFSLEAAHVNHCLRGEESERDEEFVRTVCDKMKISLHVIRSDISTLSKENSMSIEEYARKVRYDFFESLADENTKIATAHNLNDCEETMLFNLSRGASLKGLASIPPIRNNIVRPLIECSRAEIESFCYANSIEFVTDSSNLTDDYTRNRIRHNIIPLLNDINPAFDVAVKRCISSLRDDDEFLEICAKKLYSEVSTDFGFDAEKLKNSHPSLRNRVISRIIADKCSVAAERKHIELVNSILNGGRIELFGGEILVVRHNKLYFLSDMKTREFREEKIVLNNDVWSNGSIKIELKKNSTQKVYKELVLCTIDLDKIKGDLFLRKRREGDKIVLPIRKVGKSLKKLFNEMQIPPEKRDSMFILSDDESVVWVENVGTDLKKVPDENTKNFLIISIMRDEND